MTKERFCLQFPAIRHLLRRPERESGHYTGERQGRSDQLREVLL